MKASRRTSALNAAALVAFVAYGICSVCISAARRLPTTSRVYYLQQLAGVLALLITAAVPRPARGLYKL